MSKTMREMQEEFAKDIEVIETPIVKVGDELHYDEVKHVSDGTNTGFYDISDCKDLDDLSEYLDLRADEFNVLKAIYGIAKARKGHNRHNGTGIKRDANKLLHYAKRVQNRVCND